MASRKGRRGNGASGRGRHLLRVTRRLFGTARRQASLALHRAGGRAATDRILRHVDASSGDTRRLLKLLHEPLNRNLAPIHALLRKPKLYKLAQSSKPKKSAKPGLTAIQIDTELGFPGLIRANRRPEKG